jgi:hypothetical protein
MLGEDDAWGDEVEDEEEATAPRKSEVQQFKSVTPAEDLGFVPYEHRYEKFDQDVLGADDDEEDDPYTHGDRPGGTEQQGSAYVFYDFRFGVDMWPEGVELVNVEQGSLLVETALSDAEAEVKRQEEKEKNTERDAKDKKDANGNCADPEVFADDWGAGAWDTQDFFSETGDRTFYSDYAQPQVKATEEDSAKTEKKLPADAKFETLSDGSHALLLQPGFRLKLDLSTLLTGGDEMKVQREKAERKRKARGWGGSGGWAKTTMKQKVNEYTVTMDIKILDDIPREGVALFQTGLVQVGGRSPSEHGQIKQTDGEALVASNGGVGILGSFGDVSKAQIKRNRWHRVTVSVKCSADPKQNGELLSWVDAAAGAVVMSSPP